MKKELSNDNSKLSRQNILNNSIAINAIKDELRLNTIPFEDKFVLLKEQVASFFEVDSRTINNYISNFNEELTKNGYEVLSHKRLNSIKLAIEDAELPEIDFLKLKTAPQLAIFDFRAFLNIAMLLKDSNRAAEIRSLILDIAINSITSAAGGSTTYINQREDGFVYSLYNNVIYRKEFTNALDNFVDMGRIKYAIYTNKVYEAIFKEKANEYKTLLKLDKKTKIRDTMYSEVLDIIASFEIAITDKLELAFKEKNRKLLKKEVDDIFDSLSKERLWIPQITTARRKMASRDLAFRDVLHQQLEDYIVPLDPVEFEKFIGEKSKSLLEQMGEASDVLKRLKEDS